jgi:hypothetical protein
VQSASGAGHRHHPAPVSINEMRARTSFSWPPSEAIRFGAGWEQEASLRLRHGDMPALEKMTTAGPGGERDEATDEAR